MMQYILGGNSVFEADFSLLCHGAWGVLHVNALLLEVVVNILVDVNKLGLPLAQAGDSGQTDRL